MIKRFNNKAILTTQNPEAFLNFKYNPGDPSYWIIPNANISTGNLYVNGIDISSYLLKDSSFLTKSQFALRLTYDNSVASFHVYTRNLQDFDYNLKFNFYSDQNCSTLVYNTDVSGHIDVSIHNRQNIFSNLNVYDNDSIIVDNQASHLILRTNPKFTGNIKIVVDTSNNIFLDTFKVSDILSNKKYRKQKVSGDSVLSNDIRNTFKSLPLGELYSVDNDSPYDISTPKTKYSDQYNTTYNYGARLLEDELYVQDNAILAPLWINSILPEYFSVFRLNGGYNEETYTGLSSIKELASKYLKNSQLIKTWNLKNTSPIGQYLQTHLNDISMPAPVFLSLTDPSIVDADSDPNTWYGITVDTGVIAGRSETPYFFNKTINNLTELNAFVSGGFERNNLLCPNLLNLEYVFDDNDVSAYMMNRYFGLYLTENVLYNIAYYSDTKDSSVSIISLDGKDVSLFEKSNIFDSSGNISSNYSNRLFVINEGDNLIRISNINQIINNTDYVSVPKDNIFSTEVTQKNYNQFITFTLNNKLNQGEHLRMIRFDLSTYELDMWEAYGVDNELTCEPYVSNYNVAYFDPFSGFIRQTTFYTRGDIEDQIKSIEKAFDRFSDYEDGIFRSGVRGTNWLSIILNDDNEDFNDPYTLWLFQRITAQTLNDASNINSGFNNVASESDISFFGVYTPSSSDFSIVGATDFTGPINFEYNGARRMTYVNLFNHNNPATNENNLLYSFSPDVLNKFVDTILYQGEDGWYKSIQKIQIGVGLSHSYFKQYIQDPLSLETKYLIVTKEPIQTINNIWNAYSIKDINISLMGINSVKDIDYTIYDSSIGFKSEYWYNRNNDASTYQITILAGDTYTLDIRNSYQILYGTGYLYNGSSISYKSGDKFNTFFNSVVISPLSDTTVTYNILNGSENFVSYIDGNIKEENLYDYYDSSALLKYSLTVPTVSKWSGLGTNCRNNDFRLIFNSPLGATQLSNFIPFGSSFSDEISYPSYKYLSTGIRNWQDYIFYDINDVIEYAEDGSVYKTFKDLMFSKPYTDIFSKLVYSNNNVNSVKNRSSLTHYNEYNQSINVLFLGLNLVFKIREESKKILNIKKYDNYRFSFISTSSKNRDDRRPIELIINENNQTILMVWYQGNDILNYTFRNSSYLPGKSLLDASNNTFFTDVSINKNTQYSFIKTPFTVNNSALSKILSNIYGDTYDSSTGNPYAQFNYNSYGISSIWNAYTLNNIISGNVLNNGLSYNTFSQIVNYGYYPNVNTYGENIANYGYKYETNENIYTENTCELQNLINLVDPEKDFIKFYIIREDDIFTNSDFSLPPFIVNINSPRIFNNIYTYNGWFTPKFNNILEFNSNEDSYLMSVVQKDFILSNTNLQSYNYINQLWYNKVVSDVTNINKNNGNAISYIPQYNIFSAEWDANHYILSDTSSYINGYQSSLELPSFFGSKLIKLPDYLEISSWTSDTVNIEYTSTDIIMSFNLTVAINDLFSNNQTFTNNWIGLSNTNNAINSYINDTIQSYYNISISKINLNFYYKPFDTQILYSTFDTTFSKDNKTNYKIELDYVKNEYIYRITIPTTNNYSYFAKFTLFEK